jgi:DnaK suppressor protein
MAALLSAVQRAAIEAELNSQRRELERSIAEHRRGLTRTEQAREQLLQDADDAPQREAERELDHALTDREIEQLARLTRALARVHDEHFGLCGDCGVVIPFERLKAEPWAERCVACESRREAKRVL